ncbi:hypothetical protein Vgi01_56670 [Micromonospora gifhornensis]|uniref:Uncharacterized protein n=1 Tax=Micromonospora gifhornensis TaxID=84594 RepID=A0ABQ4IM34_9ACTN|nr:hypothetical protein Vgi01_56670 [Micromonospora gifhornensis]
MAKHRAPVDDRRSRREGIGSAAPSPTANLRWPVPRQDVAESWPAPRQERAEDRSAPRQDRTEGWSGLGQERGLMWPSPPPHSPDGRPVLQQEHPLNAAGPLGRTPVVGVARVPATSRLTPPGREVRNQGPRPVRRPAVLPAPAGRHRRAGESEC